MVHDSNGFPISIGDHVGFDTDRGDTSIGQVVSINGCEVFIEEVGAIDGFRGLKDAESVWLV